MGSSEQRWEVSFGHDAAKARAHLIDIAFERVRRRSLIERLSGRDREEGRGCTYLDEELVSPRVEGLEALG